jgi:uncharacterized protein YndB with AHSA1/START domain
VRTPRAHGAVCPLADPRLEPRPKKGRDDIMKTRDFTFTLAVDQSPEEVFAAVTDVRAWWSPFEGRSAQVGDEFTFRYEDLHRSTHRVIEAVPGKKVVWRTLDANLSHSKDPAEWIGTEIRFEIARKGDKTELRFTHVGLVPEFDCFEACSAGWGFVIGESLRRRITTGTGTPYPGAQSAA